MFVPPFEDSANVETSRRIHVGHLRLHEATYADLPIPTSEDVPDEELAVFDAKLALALGKQGVGDLLHSSTEIKSLHVVTYSWWS